MKFPFNGKEYYIDGFLASQLNSIVYNLSNDWDFIILVTGDRSVRVGKSVLAMTICAYLSYALNKLPKSKNSPKITSNYSLKDVYFDSKAMLEDVLHKPQYSINQYDEGREGLAASKAMKGFQQDILDWFAECGQMNNIFVIVLPDFFELKENIAVARSEFLVNVYRKEVKEMRDLFKTGEKLPVVKLVRGQFEFFSKKKKRLLYDIAKSTRRKSYNLVKADFIGSFVNQYPIDEEAYKIKKREALSRFKEKKQEEDDDVKHAFRNKYIYTLHKSGIKGPEISKILENKWDVMLAARTINDIIQRMEQKQAFNPPLGGKASISAPSSKELIEKGIVVEVS